MHLTLNRIDAYVILCARRKFKRLRHQSKGPREWFDRLSHPVFATLATAERREPCDSRLMHGSGSAPEVKFSGRLDIRFTDRRNRSESVFWAR